MKTGLTIKDISHVINADMAENSYYTTIPPECVFTDLRPDLCVFLPLQKKLTILELSVPYEPNIDKTHIYKDQKYQSLISDIEQNEYEVEYLPVEIGARGYISKDNNARLKKSHKDCSINMPYKHFINQVSKLAIISSFVVFHSKSEPTWVNPKTLKVNA